MKKVFLLMLVLAGLSLMVVSCGPDKAAMLRQLEGLEAANRADSLMQNDSLAEALADYFDRHGSPNERMRSRYILGRTYFDLGELPRALETYMEAADCADTTAADCDYKTLSRIHLQAGEVYHRQIQLRSQLSELRKAETFARKAKDTLFVIESYARQADAYSLLNMFDSVIIIKDTASRMYSEIGEDALAVITLGTIITPLVNRGELTRARKCIDDFESLSGLFDNQGNICKGREVYYYTKGNFYLAQNRLDSAEFYFRKELRSSASLNNQIAGHKGLQGVYEQRGIPDSIAKYASIGYHLNDSAYLLSEMQNIQMMQASYNYNHSRLLVQEEKLKAERLKSMLLLIIIGVIIAAYFFSRRYRSLRKAALDYQLRNANITRRLRKYAKSNPSITPTYEEWKTTRAFVEHEIPSFYSTLNSSDTPLTELEYDVCILTRLGITPIEISRLKQCSPSHVTNIRKRLLLKIFKREGRSEDFDDEIGKIYK